MSGRKSLIRFSSFFIAVAIVVAGVMLAFDYFSYRAVTFKLSSETSSVSIYPSSYIDNSDSAAKLITQREGSGTIRLKPGSYSAVPRGENVTSTPIAITVTSATSDIVIDPYFTNSYLSGQLSNEIPSINTIIMQKFPQIEQGFTLKTGTFFGHGDWYIVSCTPSSTQAGKGVDVYTLIVKKAGDSWSVVAGPSIVFTYSDNSSIPKDVIQMANQASAGLLD